MSEIFLKPSVEVNVYKKANLYPAELIENTSMIHGVEDADVHHLVFKTPEYKYMEGQSAGVIPPGTTVEGKNHAVRLYSIASVGTDVSRTPDKMVLCVKRVVYQDEKTGKTIKGVSSNYLCDLKPGDVANMTGPAGRHFVLPVSEDIQRPYLFFATGTGIAPFRAMLTRLFLLDMKISQPVYLFFGARRQAELLYDEEFKQIKDENFHYITAKSREEKNAKGGRMYVGDRLKEIKSELIDIMLNPRTLLYICGLKGMEDGILGGIREIAVSTGKDPDSFMEQLSQRIMKEVY